MGVFQLFFCFMLLAMLPRLRASYCVCKSGLATTAYQTAIDYACGQGTDCSPIAETGKCYNPNTLQAHCSFVTNSYYQKNSAKGATCDFEGAAVLTNSDPSGGGCSFSAGSGTSGSSPVTVPTSSPATPSTTPPVTGGGGIMPVTPVSGTGTPTPGTSTGTSTPGTSTGTSTPGTSTGTATNPTTGSTTPSVGNSTSTGVLGGGMGGNNLGPTGSSLDDNHGMKLEDIRLCSVLVTLVISALMCM